MKKLMLHKKNDKNFVSPARPVYFREKEPGGMNGNLTLNKKIQPEEEPKGYFAKKELYKLRLERFEANLKETENLNATLLELDPELQDAVRFPQKIKSIADPAKKEVCTLLFHRMKNLAQQLSLETVDNFENSDFRYPDWDNIDEIWFEWWSDLLAVRVFVKDSNQRTLSFIIDEYGMVKGDVVYDRYSHRPTEFGAFEPVRMPVSIEERDAEERKAKIDGIYAKNNELYMRRIREEESRKRRRNRNRRGY